MSIAGLLEGENLLLAGPKATGKNILAENLAYAFGRPVYNVSFHVNTNSGDLIGTDTFVNNEVCLRKGSIYQCAEYGGFGILDEINMAKNDAVSSCGTFYRNHELRICRNKGAERSSGFSFPGDRYASADRRNPGIYFPQNVPGSKGKGSGTVYRCIYGSSEEIRKQ